MIEHPAFVTTTYKGWFIHEIILLHRSMFSIQPPSEIGGYPGWTRCKSLTHAKCVITKRINAAGALRKPQ